MLSLEHVFVHSIFYSSVWILIFTFSPEIFVSVPISVQLILCCHWINKVSAASELSHTIIKIILSLKNLFLKWFGIQFSLFYFFFGGDGDFTWKLTEIIQHISQVWIQLLPEQAGTSRAVARNTQN